MSKSYLAGTKTKYRITLEMEVLEDMNPHQIQWDKVLKLEPAESVRAYVEDLSTPDRW
jgi:predicted component of type VI protein secretion system